MSMWPNRGEPDPRPAPGEPYRRLAPIAPARPGRPRGRSGGAASLTGVTVPPMPARILVAEDDALVAASVRRALEYEGFAVTVVGDGPAALGMAVAEPPDLVVLDVMLPGLDGFGVCRALRATGREPMVLMLTARDATADRVPGWTPAPTTTWSNRSRTRSCWRGYGRCCAAGRPPVTGPLTFADVVLDPGVPRGAPRRSAGRPDRARVRPAGALPAPSPAGADPRPAARRGVGRRVAGHQQRGRRLRRLPARQARRRGWCRPCAASATCCGRAEPPCRSAPG